MGRVPSGSQPRCNGYNCVVVPSTASRELAAVLLTGVCALTETLIAPGTGDWVACHCCGMLYAAGDVVRFYDHPGDAVCAVCADWLHSTASPPRSGGCPATAEAAGLSVPGPVQAPEALRSGGDPAQGPDPAADLAPGASPIARRRLASELKRLREAASLTCDAVAARLECSASKISRIENGQVRVSPRDTRDLLAIYGVPKDQQATYIQLARDSRQKDWWHAYRDSMLPHQATYLGLEHAAAEVRSYQLSRIPGLLQTADYARAMRSTPDRGLEDADTGRAVALLLERQWRARVSSRVLRVVLGAAALRREAGAPHILRRQIEHLIELSTLPSVHLQVMTVAASMRLSADTSFTIMDFPDPADPAVVLVRYPTGMLRIEDAAEVDYYSTLFGRIQASALPPAESAALMTSMLTGS